MCGYEMLEIKSYYCLSVSALKQELLRKHRQALQTCKSHNVAVLKSNQRTETEVKPPVCVCVSYSQTLSQSLLCVSGSGASSERRAEDDG